VRITCKINGRTPTTARVRPQIGDNSFGERDAQCEESNHHRWVTPVLLWAGSQAGANGSNIVQAFFTMDSKQRPSIDIDQANGESTLLTISLFKLAAALANAGVRL
jgi:hypothetical protein